MVAVQLVINPPDGHVLVGVSRVAIDNSAARVRRGRKLRWECEPGLAEQRGVDAVIYERRPERDLPAGVARRRRKSREISRKHCGSRHKRNDVGWVLTCSRALVSDKEK